MKEIQVNIRVSFLLLVLIHFSSSTLPRYYRINNEPGLYSINDGVTILTVDNIITKINGSDNAWLVEFYSNSCMLCQRAAQWYKEFAVDIKDWSDLVVLAAFDCGNEKNVPVCEYFNITRYPTFRYISEGYFSDPKDLRLSIVADKRTNYKKYRTNVVNMIIREQNEGRGKIYPNLKPFNNSNISKIFNKDNQILGFLIIQEPSDDIGPSIIMDFHKVKEVAIKYSYNNETKIKTNITPALFQVNTNGKLDNLVLDSADRQGFKNAIHNILLARDIVVPIENISLMNDTFNIIPTTTEENVGLRKKIQELGDVVYQLDLESALRFSLKREISDSSNQQIRVNRLEDLRKYIDVLVKYFPIESKGKYFLKLVQKYVNSSSVVSGTEIASFVREGEIHNAFSEPAQWLGCKSSSSIKRGYPCGMWKLFHYLTVNSAIESENTKDSNPRMVLEAMYGYIINFFGCEECSYYFQKMAAKREISKVTSWDESILWLWRVHNEFNERLSGDATEDPMFPKVQFPTKERCLKCWKNNDTSDEVEILSYLKKIYSKENINYLGVSEAHLSDSKMEKLQTSASSRSKCLITISSLLSFCGFVISVKFMITG